MLQIRELSYSIGDKKLLSGVNWVIKPGKRAALIGPNGAGKTTLFRILIGELKNEAGNIFRSKDYRIGYLPQEEVTFGKDSILESVLEGNNEIVELEKKIAGMHEKLKIPELNQEEILMRLGDLEHRYEILGGYRLEAEAKAILAGLGFENKDFNSSISQFSGGWRMRTYLARLLIQKPDLLLLDEPTNHLDLPSLEWLEQYLLNFPGSMVIVSHDRFFIDRLAHEIYELERGRLTHYPGNYHFFENKKEQNLILLQKKWEEQKAEREKQQKFIDRFRYKNTKATQVQSRIKQLEKLEKIELPTPPPTLNFKLTAEIQSYKDVLKINKMSFRYQDDWVLQEINLSVYRNDRIAMVGVNGAGKTTLTRLMVGQLTSQTGEVRIGKRVTVGYYAQHQVDTLNLDSTVYGEVESIVSTHNIPRVRNILGVFQFSGEDVYKKIGVLSGGEKARVSLAKILLSPVNFLIMDEPTNHLDMASKEALETALKDYDGTLIIISHDRYFLDKLVNRVIEVKDHQLTEYEGNYSDYLRLRELKPDDKNQTSEIKRISKSSSKKNKEQKRLEAEARQEISKERNRLQKEIELLESNIEKLENCKTELEKILADPTTYKQGMLAVNSQIEFKEVQKELGECYLKWEKVQGELEDLLVGVKN
ncbi:ABC-F family ATP-binding cassette domain-containing protein [candidate division KSB1 bacterium]|nr:ABC-F family ATP-binding cassette domain-containing protein [candidate division KSB1 bacterium]